MGRKLPFVWWLVAAAVLWALVSIRYLSHSNLLLPHTMASIVNKDVNNQEKKLDLFLNDSALVRKVFSGTYSEKELATLSSLPFYIYAFEGGIPRFWSNNTVFPQNYDSLKGRTTIRKNASGTFIRKSIPLAGPDSNRLLIVFIPINVHYPIENDYLQSHFVSSADIPLSTTVITEPEHNANVFPVKLKDGSTACYLRFDPSNMPRWKPDLLFLVNLIAAFFAACTACQRIVLRFTPRRNPWKALLVVLGLTLFIRYLLFALGLPYHLNELPLFSPALYASSKYLTSLGDLFIYILLSLWIIAFAERYSGYKQFNAKAWPVSLRILSTLLLQLLVIGSGFFVAHIIKSLILDSSISFDVTHFYSLNLYSILGLLAIVAIVSQLFMLFNIADSLINLLSPNKTYKYASLAISCVFFLLVLNEPSSQYPLVVIGLIVGLLLLLDVPFLTPSYKLFEPQMILWGSVISIICTGTTHYFNEQKEQIGRRAFVEQHLSPQRDNLLEFGFDEKARKLDQDKLIKSFFYRPTTAARKALNQYLETQYFTGQINKYQVDAYLYDGEKHPLYNKDTISYGTLQVAREEASLTYSSNLFYKESILDRHYYLAHIPIYSDTVNNIVGYVILDFNLKKNVSETVYPELLQPPGHTGNSNDHEYAYAVYSNGRLITQTYDYPFPILLKYDTLKPQQYSYVKNNGITTLFYRVADKRTAVVVHNHSELLETISLFSYVFGLQILIVLVIFIYILLERYRRGDFRKGKYARLTLRRRVHLSMLLVVFVSFVIIGYVTVLFFTKEYRTTNGAKLQGAMYSAKQSVQDYLTRESAFANEQIFDTVTKSATFKSFISGLANSQKIDINIYNSEGELAASSQDEIFDKGLISRKIEPLAYYRLVLAARSLVIDIEKIGHLTYNSAYQPLRDERGISLGYINVPFFSSEKDLDFRISNIVITLINLYVFIFLISGLLTVFVTRWLTRTFDIIIKQFDKLNLEQNERIDWPYDDEIGKLVQEYNKMVQKVEENAMRLAQSERESAWREMARQIAHEIKNPLTPMKLNIQYLHQAAQNNHPNINGLIARVSDSIIEQIDNLSYIASEFSNFAKLPEAKPEEINVCKLIHKAAELYNNSDDIELIINEDDAGLMVVTDKSQILRVLTNLLQNARQAIPEGRKGLIEVTITKNGDEVQIAIKDNGTGIEEEVASKIFQPYFTTKSSGTGLGLAMTKKIIEFWKGTISFETVIDEGSTFYITLPLKS